MESLLKDITPMDKINMSKIKDKNHLKDKEKYLYVPRQIELGKQISEEVRQRQFMMHTMKDLHIFYSNQLQMQEDFQLQKQHGPSVVGNKSMSIMNEPGDYFYYYNPILTPKQIVSKESITGLLSQALSLHGQLVNITENKQQCRYQVINKIQQLHRVLGSEMRPSKVVQQLKNSRQGRWETSVTLTTTDLTVKQLSTALLDNYNIQFGQGKQQSDKPNSQNESQNQQQIQRTQPTPKQDEYFKTVIQKLSMYYQTIFNTLCIGESDLREESNFERLIFNKLHAKAPECLQKQPRIIQNVQLKPYQLDGVRFLASVYVNNVTEPKLGKFVPGVCLADDMGLGKTIQTITFLMYITYQLNGNQSISNYNSNDSYGISSIRDAGLSGFGHRSRQQNIHLIITPLPVSENWKNEFQRCASDVNVLIYKGDSIVREELRKEVLKPGRNIIAIITTYDYVISDHTFFKKIPFDVVVIDEASRIKNCNSKLIFVLRNEITCKFRLLLSGTPLQNTLKELFTLLQFIHGQIFNEFSTFEAVFANIIGKLQNPIDDETSDADEENSTGNSIGISCLTSTMSEVATSALTKTETKTSGRGRQKAIPQVELTKEQKMFIIQRLHGIIKPFMIRRVKQDVLDQLPPKDEVLIRCGMSGLQIYLYSMAISETNKMLKYQLSTLQDTENDSSKTSSGQNIKNKKSGQKKSVDFDVVKDFDQVVLPRNYIRNIEIYLRKVCNHPYIAIEPGALERYQMGQMQKFTKSFDAPNLTCDEEQRQQLLQKRQRELLSFQYIRDSGKLSTLYVLLRKLKATSHKVLVFSQFKQMLTILEQFMIWAGHQYLRFDGDVKDEIRNQLVAQFNGEPGIFAFLLSTRAASHGLNLQSADTVIIYDSDYNAFYDLQAQDRCYRIGQTRPVRVFRFATNCVVEQRLLQIAAHKFSLSQAVIDAGGFDQNTLDSSNDNQSANEQSASNPNGILDRNLDSKNQLISCLTTHNFIQNDIQEDELTGAVINKKIARNQQEQRIFQQVDDEIAKEMDQLGVNNPSNMVDKLSPEIGITISEDYQGNQQNINNGEQNNVQNGIASDQNWAQHNQTTNEVPLLENIMQQNFQSQLANLNQIEDQGTNQYGFVVQQKKRGRRPLTEEEKKQQREKIIVRGKTVQHFMNNEVYFSLLDCLKNKILQQHLQFNPFQFVKDFKIAFKKSQNIKADFQKCISDGQKYNIQFSKQYEYGQVNNKSENTPQQQNKTSKTTKSPQQLMQVYCDFVHAGFSNLTNNHSQQNLDSNNTQDEQFNDSTLTSQNNDLGASQANNILHMQSSIQQKQQQITEYNNLCNIFKIRQDTLRQRYFYMYEDVFEHITLWADTDKLIDYSQILLYQILSCSECASIETTIKELNENLECQIKISDFSLRYVKFIQQRELLEIYCKTNVTDQQLKELLIINELILVHLHIINAYGIDDDKYNYANVDVSTGQVFEELLFYPAIYFNRMSDQQELRQKFKENDIAKIGFLSIDYLHFKAKTLQYESFDHYLNELTLLFNAYQQVYKDMLIGIMAQQLLSLAQKTSVLFTKGYKFMNEQIISISSSARGKEEDIIKFGSGHYGGTTMETMAYYLFRESKIKRVKQQRSRSDQIIVDHDTGESYDDDRQLETTQSIMFERKKVKQ